MVSSNVAWRQETLERLQENVQVAEQRCKSAVTFIEGLDAWEEWNTARRCLARYLEETIGGRVAAS
jgi:hypothetical protein